MASLKPNEHQKSSTTGADNSSGAIAPATIASNHSWRNPAPDKQKKFGIVALGEDFQPTQQEQRLLEMYETIKAYEKRAAYLKKDAALRKLQERKEVFEQTQNKRKTNRKKTKVADDENDENDDNQSDDGKDDSNIQEEEENDDEDHPVASKQERGAEVVLEQMRQKVAEAKEKTGAGAKEQEESKIAEFLAQNKDAEEDELELQPILTKKPRKTVDAPSLLANLGPMATPPHDFSSKLGLEPGRGKVLFPLVDDQEDLLGLHEHRKLGFWTPFEGAVGPNDGAFLVYLEDFDMEAAPGSDTNNTMAIKFSVPMDSKRFSLNIAQADQADQGFDSILFHFNPRQQRGGQLVINDKQDGVWGQALSIPLSRIPLIFGQEDLTLQIQICADGFDVYLENQHCARLEHRQDLLSSENSRLCLQFPSTDDYGSAENWKVFKVWWGYKPPMASTDTGKLAQVAGVNSFNSIHPRKLFIRGLPKIHTASEVDIRRAELERAFAKFGGSRGIVKVVVYNHKTYASVEMETDRLADLAFQEMSGRFQLNRARRTKHEALQEERLAKEQGGMAGAAARKGRGTEWD